MIHDKPEAVNGRIAEPDYCVVWNIRLLVVWRRICVMTTRGDSEDESGGGVDVLRRAVGASFQRFKNQAIRYWPFTNKHYVL